MQFNDRSIHMYIYANFITDYWYAEWNLPAKETAEIMWRLLTDLYDVRTMRIRDGNS